MKKLFFTLASLALAPAAFAQVEIGLKLSPAITSLRTNSPSTYQFNNESSKLGIGGGIIVDYFFGENYAFSTGLFLTGKGGTYTYRELVNTPGGTPIITTQKLTMQYVELPATIKLFTNEVTTDTRLYFQVGGSLAVPVQARINGEKYYTDPYDNNSQTSAGSHVLAVDANLIGGLGAEYQLGRSTKCLAGVSYHHGLVNLDRYFERNRAYTDVTIKNSVFALDLGLKF